MKPKAAFNPAECGFFAPTYEVVGTCRGLLISHNLYIFVEKRELLYWILRISAVRIRPVTRFGRSLHPGAGRPHPSSLRRKSGKVD